MIYFETERLRFRDWNDYDLIKLRQMNKDENVMRYFPSTMSDEETDIFYNNIQKEFKEYGYGLYAVESKSEGFIGFIGFHRATFEAEFTPCIEIGWRLISDAWGKGYATEGAKACLNYGFSKLNFDRVYSFTAKINLPSQNVMKKLGMEEMMGFNHPKVDKTSNLYRHVLYFITSK